MKRRLLCSLLAALLALSLAVPALAASPFGDVKETDYFYDAVLAMSGDGVITGYGNGEFRPQNPITRAELLTLLCRLAGISTEGYGSGSAWYAGVQGFAEATGVIAAGANLNATATRDELAVYAVALYQLPFSNNSGGFADTDSPYVATLKDYGLVTGFYRNGELVYGGSDNIKRCDASLLLYRLKNQVSPPDWSGLEPPVALTRVTAPDRNSLAAFPVSAQEFYDVVWYMMRNGVLHYECSGTLSWTPQQVNTYFDAIKQYMSDTVNKIQELYPEYQLFYSSHGYSAGSSYNGVASTVTIQFELTAREGLSESQVQSQITAFDKGCDDIIQGLFDNGTLSRSMGNREQAQALYQYLDYRFRYDESLRVVTPYTALRSNTGVCEGYTAVYSALCHRLDIPVKALTGNADGEPHIWNYIEDNGSTYYIDVTWGDPLPDRPNYSDLSYFWVDWSGLVRDGHTRTIDVHG